ncbi:MAG TPA: hypothetical protein PLH94_00525 [Fimbriimonadaceae bacterium]|nr:hypothetical protein [Fimbriimonadaceae bacterium]
MKHETDVVMLPLTREEAWELLNRCLSSPHADTPAARSAMQKLAAILERCEHRELVS